MDAFYEKLSNGKLKCLVCARECKLSENQRGFCYIRKRQNDNIILNSYGKLSSLAIDPIEKKPLYHFLPSTFILSLGNIGCNLFCKFCQNWQISRSKSMNLLSYNYSPEQIIDIAKKEDCPSIAFTYNEPVMSLEYILDISALAAKENIKIVAVSNGYMNSKTRNIFFNAIDAINIDLKAFTEEFYQKMTGAKLQVVLDNLIYLKHETNVWIEITNLLIPGLNDSEVEIKNMCQWILKNLGDSVPIHFSAFYPSYKLLDISSTSSEKVKKAYNIALDYGIKYVYTGNIIDNVGNNTYCIKCHKTLIKRNRLNVKNIYLDKKGKCEFCKEQLEFYL